MASLFDEFNANEPEYLNIDSLETDVLFRMRNNFESMTENYAIAVDLFNPAEDEKSRIISLIPYEDDIESEEPQYRKILAQKMLRNLGLEAPKNYSDSRYSFIAQREKFLEVIFNIERSDGSFIPVFTRFNKNKEPILVKLCTFDYEVEVISDYDHRKELVEKMNVTMGDLDPLDMQQLRDLYESFNAIQDSPETEEPDYTK